MKDDLDDDDLERETSVETDDDKLKFQPKFQSLNYFSSETSKPYKECRVSGARNFLKPFLTKVVGILGIPRSQNTIRGRLHAAIGQRRNRPRVGSDTDVLINLGGEHGGTVRA